MWAEQRRQDHTFMHSEFKTMEWRGITEKEICIHHNVGSIDRMKYFSLKQTVVTRNENDSSLGIGPQSVRNRVIS